MGDDLAQPQNAITENQTAMTGPKNRPTTLVPRRWIENSPMRIAAVSGTTNSSIDGLDDFEALDRGQHRIAGVIIESPRNSDTPKMPSAARPATRRPRGPLPPTRTEQRDQRHDPALAVVVGAHDEQHVLEGDDHHDRPEDERHDAEHGDAVTGRCARRVR